MQRKIIQSLENWKHKTNRKPLIIQGARQVGKTWAMKHFGEHSFEKVAYINFDNNPQGFIIEQFNVIENKDLRTVER